MPDTQYRFIKCDMHRLHYFDDTQFVFIRAKINIHNWFIFSNVFYSNQKKKKKKQ